MIAALLNRRADLWRVMTAPDGQGGQTETWQNLGTQPVRIAQPTDTERVAGGAHGADITHSAYLGPDADVRRGDRLKPTDGRGPDELEVLAVLHPSKPAYVRADCQSRQREG